jgi:Protein of Unknown function (DUF2784)
VSPLLATLDWSLTVLHLLVVAGNLLLWIPRPTRRWHLGLLCATCISWFGLGLFYGVGYCVLTDWHWAIKRARGVDVPSHSFVHHVLVDGLGVPLTPQNVDTLVAVSFACVVCLSVVLNVKGRTASPWGIPR